MQVGPFVRRPGPVLLSSSRCLILVVLAAALGACGTSERRADVSAGAEHHDPRGMPYAEHRIAGLRVVETIVGGEASLDDRLPVIMSIHGRGDRVRLPDRHFGGLDTPVRLLLPEASAPFHDGYTWAPVSVTENKPRELAAALRANADRLARVLEWVEDVRDVVGKPVVTGFSQGGMLSFTLAVRHPDLVGSAVPVAGWIPPSLLPRSYSDLSSLPPILAVHGTADPVVRIGPTRRAVRRLRALGFETTLTEVVGVRHVIDDALRAAVHPRLVAAVAVERGRGLPAYTFIP